MAVQSKTTLKTYFVTGAKPTETQFSNLIDSFVHVQGESQLEGNFYFKNNDATYIIGLNANAGIQFNTDVQSIHLFDSYGGVMGFDENVWGMDNAVTDTTFTFFSSQRPGSKLLYKGVEVATINTLSYASYNIGVEYPINELYDGQQVYLQKYSISYNASQSMPYNNSVQIGYCSNCWIDYTRSVGKNEYNNAGSKFALNARADVNISLQYDKYGSYSLNINSTYAATAGNTISFTVYVKYTKVADVAI